MKPAAVRRRRGRRQDLDAVYGFMEIVDRAGTR